MSSTNSRGFVRRALGRIFDWVSVQSQRFSTPITILVFGSGVWLNRYIESPASLMVDQIIVSLLTVGVLALSVVSKWRRFKGSGNRWLVGTAKIVEAVFWGLSGALFDTLLTIFAIANQLPVESVVIIGATTLLYMGLTVRILKRAQNSLSPHHITP